MFDGLSDFESSAQSGGSNALLGDHCMSKFQNPGFIVTYCGEGSLVMKEHMFLSPVMCVISVHLKTCEHVDSISHFYGTAFG